MNVVDNPKPIIIDGLPPIHKKKHTAGNKEHCVFCGRKTYRFIGGKAVCSYCSGTPEAQRMGPNWKGKIIKTEEQTYA